MQGVGVGGEEREKYTCSNRKDRKKTQKIFICLRPGYCFKQFCVAGSDCSSLTQAIWTRTNSKNHSSFFTCSEAAKGCWDPCLSLWTASTNWKDCNLRKGKSSSLLFPPLHSRTELKGRKQHLNKWFYYAGYKNRKGLSKHTQRIKFQSLVSLRGPDSPLHVSCISFPFLEAKGSTGTVYIGNCLQQQNFLTEAVDFMEESSRLF